MLHKNYPDARCVLFDLDGTLADTAPDLAQAINRTRAEDGLATLPLSRLRPFTSQGVRGLLRESYDLGPDDERYPALMERVLGHYAADICARSVLFPGMDQLLAGLEERRIAWGIVTNKHSRFTLPLVTALGLGLASRAATIVSGDTTSKPKPAPDPLLFAAQQAGFTPQECIYLGDDERDVIAAKAAGMPSFAVRWGYIGTGKPLEDWGADHIIDKPLDLMDYLDTGA